MQWNRQTGNGRKFKPPPELDLISQVQEMLTPALREYVEVPDAMAEKNIVDINLAYNLQCRHHQIDSRHGGLHLQWSRVGS